MSKDILAYPQQLVHENGAKAGILMHVTQHLPDIPQMPMVVSRIGEGAESFLARVDQARIGWPRLLRSSAIAELYGYEGDFPTYFIDSFEEGHNRARWNPHNYSMYRNQDYFDRELREMYEKVRASSVIVGAYRGVPLPDEINVIAVQKSPSKYTGTYIKHPNREDYYVIALTDTASMDRNNLFYNPIRSNFESGPKGISELSGLSSGNLSLTDKIRTDLEEVISWHDRIATLSDMDPDWAYQVEFGIDPPNLYQVRPFKPYEFATHRVTPVTKWPHPSLVVGVTNEKGLIVRVEKESDWASNQPVNDNGVPSLFYGELRECWQSDRLTNLQAAVLDGAFGLLAHSDVRTIRRSQVAVMSLLSPWSSILNHRDFVRVISDGYNAEFRDS